MTRIRELGARVFTIARLGLAAAWTLARMLWPRLVRRARSLMVFALIGASTALVLAGVALIYLPAALIGGGLAGFAFLTFNPGAARRLTWPR
jgi:hypothetical protein